MIKEAGNIKEQYASDIPASNGRLRFEAEECCGVRGGMVFPRPELRGAYEVEMSFIGS
jgi:hypothetical protein